MAQDAVLVAPAQPALVADSLVAAQRALRAWAPQVRAMTTRALQVAAQPAQRQEPAVRQQELVAQQQDPAVQQPERAVQQQEPVARAALAARVAAVAAASRVAVAAAAAEALLTVKRC